VSSTEFKTLIPLFAPLLTVFLGLIAIPFIENFKNYWERKRLLKALIEELKDEILIINNEFTDLFSCYMKAVERKNGERKTNFQLIVPASIVLFSEDKLLNNHFQNLDPNVRQSLKNIKALIEPLNIVAGKLHDQYHEALLSTSKDNTDLQILIDLMNGYLCNVLKLRYTMCYLIDLLLKNPSNLKIHHQVDFDECIRVQLEEMKKENYYNFLRS